MFNLLITKNGVNLIFKDFTVFSHTKETPFITVGNDKLSFKSSHGSFTVKEKKGSRIPLTDYKFKGDTVVFYNNDISVNVTVEYKKGMLYLVPHTDNQIENISFNFQGYPDEKIFGGGEQYRKLNLKGEKVINMVSEHITILPVVEKTLLRKIKKYRVREHSEIKTYSPMSTFVSDKLFAIRVKTNAYGVQDFTIKNQNNYKYWGLPESICVIKENTFKDISKKLFEDVESNVYLPDWVYNGMILGIQGGIDNVKSKVEKMLKANTKVSGVWCQDWSGRKVTAVGKQVYWNWQADNDMYPNLKKEIMALKNKGVHFLAYINPYLIENGKMYNYCKDKGYLIKKVDGSVYHIKSTTFNAGMMDLTNPGMVEYLKEIIIKKNMLDIGVDGYMADFGEYLPVDAVLYSGNAIDMHNFWPVLWAKLNREAIDEHKRKEDIFFFTRSGYNEVQKYTTIMWNGDQHTDFSPDYGMPCVIPASINLGLSGLTATHSDIGGFISFRNLKRSPELFIRWLEMSAFSPLMRGHETIRPDVNIQFDYDEVIQYSVKFSKIYNMLKPYYKSCMDEARKGIPFMRAPFYEYSDMSLYNEDYVYMVGSELFVAPIIEANKDVRTVSLPDGVWAHLFTGKEYPKGNYEIDAPLGTPAVFYKKGGKHEQVFKDVTLILRD